MTKTENFERVEADGKEALWAWLGAHHGEGQSVWLVTWKKPSPKYLSTGDVLDAVLAHGWIDGIRRKHECPEKTMQLIAPRKAQAWSQSYKDRVARLRAEEKMHPAGEAAIAASKSAGLWNFYADVDALIVPEDLAAEFELKPPASETFAASPASYQRNVLRWIKLAKTQATRAKRISQTAKASQAGERLPQM